ncbi:tetraacyldisaccharide 4'-kinase [Xylophilus sp. ASV27]|uniref:tetraacyldisaccharide 4'-kinase n=1 Tax=Xylophilus sp. ASV27 TaxID=2795129 RepID=UPI0018EA9BB6
MNFSRALQQAWLRRGALAWLLWPLSLAYGLLWRLRALAYRQGWLRSERLPVPVLVVGNVVAGGAGKTPTVIAVLEHLRARGIAAGVVSRGYGRRLPAGGADDVREVQPHSTPAEAGDEPLLIRRRTGVPVFVGRDRAAAARRLLARYPATRLIVCDDGLQHLALGRDIEVCVFDDRGVGNGFLLPAGPLREPWPRPVAAVLHTGAHPAFAGFTARRRLADHALRADGSRVALASLGQQPLHALAGIARPQAFFDMLRERGLCLAHTEALPDHYDFDSWKPRQHLGFMPICTEKDAAKLWRVAPQALAVPLRFEPEPAFLARLDRLLDARL